MIHWHWDAFWVVPFILVLAAVPSGLIIVFAKIIERLDA